MKNLLRKISLILCSAVMLMGMSAVGVYAATEDVGDFTITKSGYGSSLSVSVSGYNGKGGDITLPTSVSFYGTEYTITEVGSAFTDNELITGVTIPEGYSFIGLNAFANCTELKSVSIPGSMSLISATAFANCPKLETVTFADGSASSLTIRNDVFLDCTALTSLELPKRLSTATSNFVRGCTSLTSLTIREGAEDFATVDNVLYELTPSASTAKLVAYPFGNPAEEFTIPSEINGYTVTATAMHMFRNNAVLKKVTVPATVTNLGGFTFSEMTAIEEIVLEQESAPTLGSSVFSDMAAGSKITVKNEEVANAIINSGYYTPENTTVSVAGAETPEEKTVSAAVSISAESEIKDGTAVYGIYLDNAENVSTVLLKISFDSAQVSTASITNANDAFTSGTSSIAEEDGKLVLKAYMGILGDENGFSSEEKTKLADISASLKDGVKGNITAEIVYAEVAGITDSSVKGDVTLNTASASVFVPNYDVNGDGTVDIIDITEAQRYYKSVSTDENRENIKAMDVNGDNIIDIQDYIDIFNNLTDF